MGMNGLTIWVIGVLNLLTKPDPPSRERNDPSPAEVLLQAPHVAVIASLQAPTACGRSCRMNGYSCQQHEHHHSS